MGSYGGLVADFRDSEEAEVVEKALSVSFRPTFLKTLKFGFSLRGDRSKDRFP